MKLSQQIRQTMSDHARLWPDGDWKAANEQLGTLWRQALPFLLRAKISPWLGNEEKAAALEALGQ